MRAQKYRGAANDIDAALVAIDYCQQPSAELLEAIKRQTVRNDEFPATTKKYISVLESAINDFESQINF